jgi:hypothetical protein
MTHHQRTGWHAYLFQAKSGWLAVKVESRGVSEIPLHAFASIATVVDSIPRSHHHVY